MRYNTIDQILIDEAYERALEYEADGHDMELIWEDQYGDAERLWRE